jgi:hypothetical protein
MTFGICLKCGWTYYGLALKYSNNNICNFCGSPLKIFIKDHNQKEVDNLVNDILEKPSRSCNSDTSIAIIEAEQILKENSRH